MSGASSPVFVACEPGLEALLVAELTEILGRPVIGAAGGAEVSMSPAELLQVCLRCGVASHARVRVGRFPARHFSQLDKSLRKLPWGRFLSAGDTVRIRPTAKSSKLYHTGGIADRVAGALPSGVSVAGSSPDPGTDEAWLDPVTEEERAAAPDQVLHVRIDRDVCTVAIEASGAPLHRRGYRLATAKAPLREDLAYAAVRWSGWAPGQPFFDPFCGSGTLGIEAARLAAGIWPGAGRRFACEGWPELAGVSRSEPTPRPIEAPIRLSDRDAGAVQAAQENAARAGVQDFLQIEEAPMGRAPMLETPPEGGVWLSNPPHGGRIGRKKDLRPLYQALGRRFEALPDGWRLALVVRDRKLAYATGVRLASAGLVPQGGKKVSVMIGPASAKLDAEQE